MQECRECKGPDRAPVIAPRFLIILENPVLPTYLKSQCCAVLVFWQMCALLPHHLPLEVIGYSRADRLALAIKLCEGEQARRGHQGCQQQDCWRMFRRIGMPCYRPFVVQVVVVLFCVLLLVRLFVFASSRIRSWKVVVSSS